MIKKIRSILLIAVFLAFMPACSGGGNTAAEPVYPEGKTTAYAEDAFVKAVNAFAFATIPKVIAEKTENNVYSPVSLYMALSLAATGANGGTQEELLSALKAGGKDKQYISKQNSLLFKQLYRDNDTGKLKIANSLWMDKQANFKKEYTENAAQNFYASVYNVDFSNPDTAGKMSGWIADHTGGVLKPAIKITPQEFMSIINTLYLKDEWLDPFNKKATAKDVFHKADGSQTECDFMNTGGHLAVWGDGYHSAFLNLKNAGSMWFVLPDENVEINSLLSDPEKMAAMFDKDAAKNANVIFCIPKFSFGNSFDLIPALKALGVSAAFTDEADFSAMTGEPAFISQVRQDGHIAIDENGVEAAAFTQIMLAAGAEPPAEETVEMKLDRPFIFGITAHNGILLFSGVVYDPGNIN